MARYWKRKEDRIQRQVLGMSNVWGRFFTTLKMRNKTARWVGSVRPTPLSDQYKVEIEYKLGNSPQVRVLEPTLVPRQADGKIPHVYPGNRPCLYLPKKNEWTDEMLIAHTIVPWLALWLYHYEMWHSTGEWLGGGEHPVPSENKIEQESMD